MKKIQLFLLLCIAIFATGCPNQPSKNFKDSELVNNINAYLGDLQTKTECYSRQRILSTDNKCIESGQPSYPGGPNEAKILRNQALDKAMAVIDDNYTVFITKIDSRRSETDFIADVIELGTGAAIGITKGERPNQILGIALTAFRGGRRSSELNFYKQQTTPILIAKMDDNRARVQASILQRRERTINEYSAQEAIRDIVAYYNAGTLIIAFTELGKDTAAQAKDSEKAVRILRGDVEITDIPTEASSATTTAIFRQNRSLENQLTAATVAADTAENAITLPTPVAATAPETERQANTAAIETAKTNRAKARTEKLKPIRDKLEAIWNQVKDKPSLSPVVAEMKADDDFKDVFAKLDATPPQPVTEDNYLDLLIELTRRIAANPEAKKDYLAILTKVNK